MHHPEKVGTVSPSSDTGTTHVTLVKVPRCQLFYIPCVFKHCDLVLKIMILWETVCITLYSQNPNAAFKIRVWVLTHGLWRAGSSEHRVIPSKLMKRRWKYLLRHQEGGQGIPLKDSKLRALNEKQHVSVRHKHFKTHSWQKTRAKYTKQEFCE